MESGELGLEQMWKSTNKVFKKYGNRLSMKKYKKVLEAINIVPEDDFTLYQYFESVDQDGDGYITFEDFEE